MSPRGAVVLFVSQGRRVAGSGNKGQGIGGTFAIQLEMRQSGREGEKGKFS